MHARRKNREAAKLEESALSKTKKNDDVVLPPSKPGKMMKIDNSNVSNDSKNLTPSRRITNLGVASLNLLDYDFTAQLDKYNPEEYIKMDRRRNRNNEIEEKSNEKKKIGNSNVKIENEDQENLSKWEIFKRSYKSWREQKLDHLGVVREVSVRLPIEASEIEKINEIQGSTSRATDLVSNFFDSYKTIDAKNNKNSKTMDRKTLTAVNGLIGAYWDLMSEWIVDQLNDVMKKEKEKDIEAIRENPMNVHQKEKREVIAGINNMIDNLNDSLDYWYGELKNKYFKEFDVILDQNINGIRVVDNNIHLNEKVIKTAKSNQNELVLSWFDILEEATEKNEKINKKFFELLEVEKNIKEYEKFVAEETNGPYIEIMNANCMDLVKNFIGCG